MKILLVVPKYDFSKKGVSNQPNYDYLFPIGLSYISAILKKNNYEVDGLNLNHCSGGIPEIIKNKLNSTKYDIVGTGGNALTYHVIETILKSVKQHDSLPKTILGGPIITSEPEVVFNALKPDFAVIGEGEITIINLLKTLEKNLNLENVKGIAFWDKEGKARFNAAGEIVKDLNNLPLPDYDSFEFEKFLDNINPFMVFVYNCLDYPRVYPLLGSRACPFQCTFCYHDTRYRARTIDNVMNELNFVVKKYKINLLMIYDDCFASTKVRLYEFCNKISKLRSEISWELKWACQLLVNTVDKEMLDTMKKAGCDSVSYGFESFSSDVLKSMRKPITPQQIDKAFYETMGVGLAVQANFIFGDVAETKETSTETLNYWKTRGKGQIGIGFIQPYPGSEIYNHCLKKGIIADKLDFIKNKAADDLWLNMTDKMSNNDIKELKNEILGLSSKYYKFTLPISIKNMDNNRYTIKVKCPFCNEIIEYKNGILKNRWLYSIFIVCRNCHMRFFMTSSLAKWGYKHYPKIKTIRDYQNKLFRKFKK